MMTRYAVYFMPHVQSDLWQLGSSVIGYDAASGENVVFPALPIFTEPNAPKWTEEPRKYGFHATLKAPFSLKGGLSENDLLDAAAQFADSHRDFCLPQLIPAVMSDFIALVPVVQSNALQALAADCVIHFEPLRAPLDKTDYQRRLQAGLTPEQISHLDQFGYPYVFENFRFHMTLTGAIEEPARARWLAALKDCFAPIRQPVPFDGIAIFRQSTRQDRFVVLHRFQLTRRAG